VLLAQALDLGDQRRMVLRREPLLIHSAPLYASRSEASTPSMHLRPPMGTSARFPQWRRALVLI
jgi:hypothetical protein